MINHFISLFLLQTLCYLATENVDLQLPQLTALADHILSVTQRVELVCDQVENI